MMNNQIQYQEGKKLIEQGALEEAALFFNKQKEIGGQDAVVHYYLAVIYYKQEKYSPALTEIEQAISLKDDEAEFYCHQGIVLHMNEQSNEAIQFFDKAVSLEPDNPYRYSSRAFIKAHIKDYDGAVADYEKTLALDPDDAIAHNNLGMLREQMGYAQEAKKHYNKADDLTADSKEEYNRPDVNQLIEEWKKEKEAQKKNKEEQKRNKKEGGDLSEGNSPVKTIKSEAVTHNANDYVRVIKEVFTQKETFKEFIKFIGNGFKLPSDNDQSGK